jgi:hypothetical protein
MTARLCREGVIESVTNRPFIALAGHLAAAEAAYGSKAQKRRRGRPTAPTPDGARVQSDVRLPPSDYNNQLRATMSTRPAKKIVEDALGPARTRALWTANYYPALPFTPQSFEVGVLLPAMLFMARFGHPLLSRCQHRRRRLRCGTDLDSGHSPIKTDWRPSLRVAS